MLWTNLEIMVLTELVLTKPDGSNQRAERYSFTFLRHYERQTITSVCSCHKVKGILDNSTLYSSRILILQIKKKNQECPRLKLVKETQ